MKKRAGFTLIELVIGTAIMLIIFGGIVYIFGASSKSAMAGMNHKQAYESARNFMDEIKMDLSRKVQSTNSKYFKLSSYNIC